MKFKKHPKPEAAEHEELQERARLAAWQLQEVYNTPLEDQTDDQLDLQIMVDEGHLTTVAMHFTAGIVAGEDLERAATAYGNSAWEREWRERRARTNA